MLSILVSQSNGVKLGVWRLAQGKVFLNQTMWKSACIIAIAFHSPAKPIVLNRPQGQFSADFFLFAFRSQTCEQNREVHMILAQLTIDNSII